MSFFAPLHCLHAQRGGDHRERLYHYEVFSPQHRPKPPVEGWAEQRVEEKLDRGLHAALNDHGQIYLSWRLKREDDPEAGFNLYRRQEGKNPVKLNSSPLTQTTDFVDEQTADGMEYEYWVTPVVEERERDSSEKVVVGGGDPASRFRSIKLKEDCEPNRIAVADLNGDGEYDFVVKHPDYNIDPARPPNTTGLTYKIDAYLSDGTFLWRKDLGLGIEPGIWYSPLLAFDFNGDGRAEIAVKTAPNQRDPDGRVREGGEWVSIWDGMTGKEITRADWPERSDRFGLYNRLNRNQLGVAYLDGKTPCLIVARGTYRLMMADAYQLHNGNLEKLWRWDGDEENPIIRAQGAHTMHGADVDGDGRDEVILGSVVLNDNGTALWSAGLGHPDRVFVTNIDPQRPGLEILYTMCNYSIAERGVTMVDAATGRSIWDIGVKTRHVGSGMVADVDPDIPGLEVFASEDPKMGLNDNYMLTAKGESFGDIDDFPVSDRNWIWWDADLLREHIRSKGRGPDRSVSIVKFGGDTVQDDIGGRLTMMADLYGDWREELVTVVPGEIRVHCTTIPASDRRVSLVQDPLYRNNVAHRSMGYHQTPIPSFYLGE